MKFGQEKMFNKKMHNGEMLIKQYEKDKLADKILPKSPGYSSDFDSEGKEENNRINANDLKSNEKGQKMNKYIPIEEVVDPDTEENEETEEETSGVVEMELPDKEETEKLKEKSKAIKKQDIGEERHEGSLHVGPDYSPDNSTIHEEFESDGIIVSPEREKINYTLYNKGIRSRKEDRNTGQEKDNLKTETISKKERRHRIKIKKILNDTKNWFLKN